MYEFHSDIERYFHYQYLTAKDYIIPFVSQARNISTITQVLEIGCGEGGVLKAFREIGCSCVGIDLAAWRIKRAISLHDQFDLPGDVEFITEDIYNIGPESGMLGRFDLVILKDVIEHIPAQEKIIPALKKFLSPGGVIFFAFPPWQMPFGGHQQRSTSKVFSKIPYTHLLPKGLYNTLISKVEHRDVIREDLESIKETGITIEKFEKIIGQSGLRIANRKFWLLNPIYKHKFGKGPVEQSGLISAIPYLRNFITTAVYYNIVEKQA